MTDKQRLELFSCVNNYTNDLMEAERMGSEAILDMGPYFEPTIDRWLEEAREEGRSERRRLN